MSVSIAPHPLLHLEAVEARFPAGLGSLPAMPWLTSLLQPGADAPVAPPAELLPAIRDLLRHGGFKPSGRSKPSSEYLAAAAAEGRLGSINAAADIGNAVSLHSGLPVSVVDADRLSPPLRVAVAAAGIRCVFNPSGQELDAGGLLCLHDAGGPCANAVKDAQRTKTHAGTVRILALVWGVGAAAAGAQAARRWMEELLARAGARAAPVRALRDKDGGDAHAGC